MAQNRVNIPIQQALDRPIGGREPLVRSLIRSGSQQDWEKYYEQRDPGTSTDVLDTDEARQTTSLILQEASMMTVQGGDEVPLIFATQTAATVADLDIEGFDPDNPGGFQPVVTSNMNTVMEIIHIPPSGLDVLSQSTVMSGDPRLAPLGTRISQSTMTAISTTTFYPSVFSVVPYSHNQVSIQPYNSSIRYEDAMLPVFVDYIGSIMPIIYRQSITTNWPPTPHPATGQVR